MNFNPGLKPEDTVNNVGLSNLFKCGLQGGMRRSHRTNTLVIISDPYKAIYRDRWIGDVFHYTGMGLTENQSLSFSQNKTLAESSMNDVDVHLFEVHEEKRYTYVGKVALAGLPYEEQQPDVNGNIRNVWMFPLKVKGQSTPIEIPEILFQKKQERKARVARELSDEELAKRAQHAPKETGRRQVANTRYERNEDVSEYAKRRAKGFCQLCDNPAPFNDKQGNPFLETHHIKWLSEEGADGIENTVALCPNCHRKMHSLNLKADIEKLNTKAASDLSCGG